MLVRKLQQNSGVVIIAVLWICALITWIAFEISADTRLRGQEDAQLLQRSQALYLAIGGANEALARMGTPAPLDADASSQAAWQPDGNPQVVYYRTGEAVVIIEDENQKVNVNNADHAQLQDVLENAGLSLEDASVMADMIQDFIDPDDTPKMHGAERDKYKSMGIPYPPFNGPLTSVDQLLLVPGISADLFYHYSQDTETEIDTGRDRKSASSKGRQDLLQGVTLPGRDSLFEMFTVYGTNTALPKNGQDSGSSLSGSIGGRKTAQGSFTLDKDGEDAAQTKTVSWTSGGVYRIISCGRGPSGIPTVVLCMIVRYAPESRTGFEVLYRNIL